MQLLKQVENWCARPGNSKAKLATLLGLESSGAISNWISRGEIPERHKKRIELILKGKTK